MTQIRERPSQRSHTSSSSVEHTGRAKDSTMTNDASIGRSCQTIQKDTRRSSSRDQNSLASRLISRSVRQAGWARSRRLQVKRKGLRGHGCHRAAYRHLVRVGTAALRWSQGFSTHPTTGSSSSSLLTVELVDVLRVACRGVYSCCCAAHLMLHLKTMTSRNIPTESPESVKQKLRTCS